MQKILNFDNPRWCSVSLGTSQVLVLEEVLESFVLSRTKLTLEGQVFRLWWHPALRSSDFDAAEPARAKLTVIFELFPRLARHSTMFTLFVVLVYMQSKFITGGELLGADPTLVVV